MNDQSPTPHLARRDVLRSLGALAASTPLLALPLESRAATGGPCRLTPAETEGPFFVDGQLERSDLRLDPSDGSRRAGVPLRLDISVMQSTQQVCAALAAARIDVWHADAFGAYSAVAPSTATRYLRGYQHTDATGRAVFDTIVPGWYEGRTPHIHLKIRTAGARAARDEFTSQLYFRDDVLDTIYRRAPYATRPNRRVRNEDDGIFSAPLPDDPAHANGTALLLALEPAGDGYTARFTIALDPSRPVAPPGPWGPPPNGPSLGPPPPPQ